MVTFIPTDFYSNLWTLCASVWVLMCVHVSHTQNKCFTINLEYYLESKQWLANEVLISHPLFAGVWLSKSPVWPWPILPEDNWWVWNDGSSFIQWSEGPSSPRGSDHTGLSGVVNPAQGALVACLLFFLYDSISWRNSCVILEVHWVRWAEVYVSQVRVDFTTLLCCPSGLVTTGQRAKTNCRKETIQRDGCRVVCTYQN